MDSDKIDKRSALISLNEKYTDLNQQASSIQEEIINTLLSYASEQYIGKYIELNWRQKFKINKIINIKKDKISSNYKMYTTGDLIINRTGNSAVISFAMPKIFDIFNTGDLKNINYQVSDNCQPVYDIANGDIFKDMDGQQLFKKGTVTKVCFIDGVKISDGYIVDFSDDYQYTVKINDTDTVSKKNTDLKVMSYILQ